MSTTALVDRLLSIATHEQSLSGGMTNGVLATIG